MTSQSFKRELEVAIDLARQAGSVIMQHYVVPTQVDYKTADESNPVTQADRDANKLIVEGLMGAFPSDAILAEESPPLASRHEKSRLWCVDPLDGTREFIARNGQFVVMIGLAVEGHAVLGVLYHPTEDTMYWGAPGEAGMQVKGTRSPIQVSRQTAPEQSTLMVSRSHHSEVTEKVAREVGFGNKLPTGSVGLKVARIAAGQGEAYISLSNQTHEWDACAPEAVLQAAGGRMTDICGQPLKYNKTTTPTPCGLLATNGHLHPRCLKALEPCCQNPPWL